MRIHVIASPPKMADSLLGEVTSPRKRDSNFKVCHNRCIPASLRQFDRNRIAASHLFKYITTASGLTNAMHRGGGGGGGSFFACVHSSTHTGRIIFKLVVTPGFGRLCGLRGYRMMFNVVVCVCNDV